MMVVIDDAQAEMRADELFAVALRHRAEDRGLELTHEWNDGGEVRCVLHVAGTPELRFVMYADVAMRAGTLSLEQAAAALDVGWGDQAFHDWIRITAPEEYAA